MQEASIDEARERLDELIRCEIDVFYHQPDVATFVFAGARFVRAVRPVSQFIAAERQYDLAHSRRSDPARRPYESKGP